MAGATQNNVVLTSIIDSTHFLGAKVSHEKPQDNFEGFTVPCNIIKGWERSYIQLYNMQCYSVEDLQSEEANFISGDRLEEKERQEVEGMLWYIFLDSDTHYPSKIRHMKIYVTVDGQIVISLSCREFNHKTGRPIVMVLGETPVVRQIDESSLVTNKHNRGDNLTADEEDLAIRTVECLVGGLPDYELKPIPLSARRAKPSRVRKKLSNGTEVATPQPCRCPPLPVPEDGTVGRMLIDFLSHREQGCRGDCGRCSRLIDIVRQTVGCRAIDCSHKGLLVQDYVKHPCTYPGGEACPIPFCDHSRHLVWENKEELGPWIITDVVENTIRTIIYPCQPPASKSSHQTDVSTKNADDVETRLAAHDRQLGIHDVRLAEMDLRFQILETASFDGTLLWKIKDYTRRKHDAVTGRTLSLYSQPFYTSRNGYKMCARVYLNGDGLGKGTHMSLLFVVMQGEYDTLLPWPFRQKVTLMLLDQDQGRRHLSDTFRPDPTSSSFKRPTSDMNIASGCPLFVCQAVVEGSPYLKDDTIFIKVIVETSDLLVGPKAT